MDAIILAAGEGTRLRPLTSTRPKPMLPVAGQTILERGLEALSNNGIKRAVLVVGYKKEVIIDAFGDRFRDLELSYVEQKEQLGTAHAVSMAEGRVDDDFIVMNGDLIVSDKLIGNFIKDHTENKAKNSMCLKVVKNPSDFGIVELSENRVQSLTEKPEKPASNLANAGIYIFGREIFDAIKDVGKSERLEYELTDAISLLIKKKKVSGFKAQGDWIDVGRPWDLLDANENLLPKTELEKDPAAVIEDYAVLKGDVRIGEGTLIRSGAYIEGPCYIGANCAIGPNCYIRPYTYIMDRVHIGNAVEIKNSIIMSGTNIGHLSYVGDSIIGEKCNFGAGTKVANLRVDNDEVKIEIKKKLMKSGRRKFGCIMGDNVKTGINVSIMPGRSIYPNAYVEAASVVRNTIYTEQH